MARRRTVASHPWCRLLEVSFRDGLSNGSGTTAQRPFLTQVGLSKRIDSQAFPLTIDEHPIQLFVSKQKASPDTMRISSMSLPAISSDRRGIRRLARTACPSGVVWISDAVHPETARAATLPFIFAVGRLRAAIDPFAVQRPSAGSQRGVRELDLVVAAMLQMDPEVSADVVRRGAAHYAGWIVNNVPTTHARLRGQALAGWWPSWMATAT